MVVAGVVDIQQKNRTDKDGSTLGVESNAATGALFENHAEGRTSPVVRRSDGMSGSPADFDYSFDIQTNASQKTFGRNPWTYNYQDILLELGTENGIMSATSGPQINYSVELKGAVNSAMTETHTTKFRLNVWNDDTSTNLFNVEYQVPETLGDNILITSLTHDPSTLGTFFFDPIHEVYSMNNFSPILNWSHIVDKNIRIRAWTSTSSKIPEASTVGLFVTGLMMMFIRRKITIGDRPRFCPLTSASTRKKRGLI